VSLFLSQATTARADRASAAIDLKVFLIVC
jgi:hypothetical protein